jgi:hypothetical protein
VRLPNQPRTARYEHFFRRSATVAKPFGASVIGVEAEAMVTEDGYQRSGG